MSDRNRTYAREEFEPETFRDVYDPDYQGTPLTPSGLAGHPEATPVKIEAVVTFCPIRGHIDWTEATFADGTSRALEEL